MAEETKDISVTEPGGRYIVNGKTVNANGEEIKETAKSKPADAEEKETAKKK